MKDVDHGVCARKNLDGRTVGEGQQRCTLEVQYLSPNDLRIAQALGQVPSAVGHITSRASELTLGRKTSEYAGSGCAVEDEGPNGQDEW